MRLASRFAASPPPPLVALIPSISSKKRIDGTVALASIAFAMFVALAPMYDSITLSRRTTATGIPRHPPLQRAASAGVWVTAAAHERDTTSARVADPRRTTDPDPRPARGRPARAARGVS